MSVHPYEKFWIGVSLAVLVTFVTSIFATGALHGAAPPSRIETIDPVTSRSDPRFAQLGVAPDGEDGSVAIVLAQTWMFLPGEIRVPPGPVTFRITSPDLIHGFQIVGTNVNAMVVPGYVTEVRTRLDREGEYLLACNEYCGLGHHLMAGKVVVARTP